MNGQQGSRSVLLPLAVAFLLYWLGTFDLRQSAGKFTAAKPVQPKVKTP